MNTKAKTFRIFLADTGEEVAQAQDCHITLSEDKLEPLPWPAYEPIEWTITGTLKETDAFREMFFFTKGERRRMFHAVTHGKAVTFMSSIGTEGKEERIAAVMYIDSPRVLRIALATLRNMRIAYDIVPLSSCRDFVRLADFINR